MGRVSLFAAAMAPLMIAISMSTWHQRGKQVASCLSLTDEECFDLERCRNSTAELKVYVYGERDEGFFESMLWSFFASQKEATRFEKRIVSALQRDPRTIAVTDAARACLLIRRFACLSVNKCASDHSSQNYVLVKVGTRAQSCRLRSRTRSFLICSGQAN